MFGLVHCNASILARQNTDANLYFARTIVKNWLWPIITVFGVTGNILAIIVLTKRRMILSSTNNYLVALAIVDIAYLILTLIINTLQNPCFMGTSLSEIILTICRPVADFSSNSSVWLTVTFTVERWVAITYPLQSRTWCTVKRARRIIFGVLLASLICTLPSAFEMKLVRIVEQMNVSNTTIDITYIKAKPTALGNSLLYHQIYFNFVTFAIIWIPLVLLLIFNTILIACVRRSMKKEQKNTDGVQLRRHNRASHIEQRKTTIMLIAVVIVFTVCQIPQAISLTVQSFFPKLAQTSKVLIYNNFANCFVALNASTNFLLYCSFSARFRSIFRSNFKFIYKFCAYFIGPSSTGRRSTEHQARFNSFDNTSITNQSYNSFHGTHGRSSVANISIDINPKYFQQILRKQSQLNDDNNAQSCFNCCSKFSSKNDKNAKRTRISQSTESYGSSPSTSLVRNPCIFLHQKCSLTTSATGERTYKLSLDEKMLKRERLLPNSAKNQLSDSHESNRPKSKSISHTISPSSHSLTDNNQEIERISLNRYRSNSTNEQLLNGTDSENLKQVLDINV